MKQNLPPASANLPRVPANAALASASFREPSASFRDQRVARNCCWCVFNGGDPRAATSACRCISAVGPRDPRVSLYVLRSPGASRQAQNQAEMAEDTVWPRSQPDGASLGPAPPAHVTLPRCFRGASAPLPRKTCNNSDDFHTIYGSFPKGPQDALRYYVRNYMYPFTYTTTRSAALSMLYQTG